MASPTISAKWPVQTGPGTREWAEEQIRLCGRNRRSISLRRINALLDANGFPMVTS
jgi:hypothetical protein